MNHPLLPIARAIAGLVLLGAAGVATAQTAPPPATAPTTQPATAETPTGKLVSTFSGFAGSEENAASLVNGLRTGSAITLTGGAGTGGGETTTFTSPTRPMGYGNIRIAMSLAEAQLASQGVTNPTPTQLQGALMGTTTGTGADATTTQGILQMRASGMGWGQIANSMGFKLGPVMSGKQTFTEAVAAGSTTTAAGTAAGAGAARGKSGVTTAGGGGSNSGKGVTTAAGASAKGVATAAGASGKGVTTAGGSGGNAYGHARSSVVTAGGGGGGAVATGLGHGNAGGASAGVVSAAGQGGGNAGGQGGGHGKGGGKP